MRMIPITTHKMSLIILSSHLVYVCMLLATECPLKKSKNDLRSCPGHQKTVLCNEKEHMLWSPPLIYVPLDKRFNLFDSVSAHIKWRKFYINCETGVRIKWNNLQESACHVLSPWQMLESCSNIADSWSCNSTHFKANTLTFSIFSTT